MQVEAGYFQLSEPKPARCPPVVGLVRPNYCDESINSILEAFMTPLLHLNSRGLLVLVAGSVAALGLDANQSPSPAAPAVPFLAHQASYELSLLKSRANPAVDAASGRILYSFTGSQCEGYTTEFRQVSQVDTEGGKSKVSAMRSTRWED